MSWFKKANTVDLLFCTECKNTNYPEDVEEEDGACTYCGDAGHLIPNDKEMWTKCRDCGEEWHGTPRENCQYCPGTDLIYGSEAIAADPGPETPSDVFHAAKKKFGKAYNLNLAGWLLPDGTFLSLSYDGLSRNLDHRSINAIMGKFGDESGTVAMYNFMRMGAIRMHTTSSQEKGADIMVRPTPSQYESLEEFFNTFSRFEIYVNITSSSGESNRGQRFEDGYEALSWIARQFGGGGRHGSQNNWLKKSAALPAGYFSGIKVALETMTGLFRMAIVDNEDTVQSSFEKTIYEQLSPKMGFEDVTVIDSGEEDGVPYVIVVNPQTEDAACISYSNGEIVIDPAEYESMDSKQLEEVYASKSCLADIVEPGLVKMSCMKKLSMHVKKIVRQRKYKHGYIIRDEYWATYEDDPEDEWTLMDRQAYNPSGEWIGDSKTAYFLCKTRGIMPEKANPDHCVCSIGYNPNEKKWYGWSHRGICGFGVGDKLFDQSWPGATPKTNFKRHGEKTIETMEEAKLAAKNFASYLS